MLTVTNFALFEGCLDEFGGYAGLKAACDELGLDGIEAIYDDSFGADTPLPDGDLCPGYHLMFWADWVDFWLGDRDVLDRKFGGDEKTIRECYGGLDRSCMVERYRADLERAERIGARYVVFHVSEVSHEECFTYRWLHDDATVIDASIECANEALAGHDWPFAFLVENQWWSGFTFTDPAMTQRLLDGIEFADKGIMLDTGHLLNTNRDLTTQAGAAAYIDRMLDEHGELAKSVRGMHLHQSLSGEYVKAVAGRLPENFDEGTYWDRFGKCYAHVLKIDTHQPWTDPAIAKVVERIDPEFLNNELSASGREAHMAAVRTQLDTLRRGGLDV